MSEFKNLSGSKHKLHFIYAKYNFFLVNFSFFVTGVREGGGASEANFAAV